MTFTCNFDCHVEIEGFLSGSNTLCTQWYYLGNGGRRQRCYHRSLIGSDIWNMAHRKSPLSTVLSRHSLGLSATAIQFTGRLPYRLRLYCCTTTDNIWSGLECLTTLSCLLTDAAISDQKSINCLLPAAI